MAKSTKKSPKRKNPLAGCKKTIDGLRECGAMFHSRGWSVGTSSNYSVIVQRDPVELIVTASGKHKERLERDDFVRIGADGKPTVDGQPKSSAETMLHVVLAEQPEVGAVLHTHSVWSTVLSDFYAADGGFEIEGYEMLKGLAGVQTHDTSAWVQIFDNTQDIPALAEEVTRRLNDAERPLTHGFLIRRHGLYTWGVDLDEARRQIEIFEFLFECVGRLLMLTGQVPDATSSAYSYIQTSEVQEDFGSRNTTNSGDN